MKYFQQFDLACYEIDEYFQVSGSCMSCLVSCLCMDHSINFVSKAGQSRTVMVKSFKITPLVLDSRAFFRLTPFHVDFIDYMEYDIDVKDLTKLLALVLHQLPSLIILLLMLLPFQKMTQVFFLLLISRCERQSKREK